MGFYRVDIIRIVYIYIYMDNAYIYIYTHRNDMGMDQT